MNECTLAYGSRRFWTYGGIRRQMTECDTLGMRTISFLHKKKNNYKVSRLSLEMETTSGNVVNEISFQSQLEKTLKSLESPLRGSQTWLTNLRKIQWLTLWPQCVLIHGRRNSSASAPLLFSWSQWFLQQSYQCKQACNSQMFCVVCRKPSSLLGVERNWFCVEMLLQSVTWKNCSHV